LSYPTAGRLPRHIQLSNFDLSLERGSGGRLQPVVRGLQAHITESGLRELAQGLVDEADRRAPVGLSLKHTGVGPSGIDLVLGLEKSIFRSDLSTRLKLSAPGGDRLRVELSDAEMPAWVPLDVLLDEVVKRGGGAVQRDPGNRRALLLDPAALLQRFGVPGRFAPGRWDVTTGTDGVTLTFREDAAGR
jgi:hypothetical protein